MLFEKSSMGGNRDASFMMGCCFRDGTELVQDYARAYALFEKASNAQHIEATYWLGVFYRKGLGVKSDHTKSLIMYHRAADAGFQPAVDYVNSLKQES